MSEPATERTDAAALTPAPAGIIYSCFGERYVMEALRSARSSLRHNHVPHLIFAGSEVPDPPPGVSVVRFEPSPEAPYAGRISNMRASPFERTLFLDTDTYIVDEIVHVLDLLDHYDLAVAQSPGYRGLVDPEVPKAFPEFNCGVIAWRASERVDAFLQCWEETYRSWLREEVLTGLYGGVYPTRGDPGDQPPFRRCAWQHGMRVATLPPEYNLRLGIPTTVIDRVRVLHGHTDKYEMFAQRYNEKTGPRTFPRDRLIRPVARRLYKRLRRRIAQRS